MSDRDTILQRIRSITVDDIPGPDEQTAPAYRHSTAAGLEERVAQFAERVAEYRATVRRVAAKELGSAIAAACRRRNVNTLVVPDDIPPDWLPGGIAILRDAPIARVSNERLDSSDGVLTGCALGIAQTGTIVLDGGEHQGRRVISLLPDYHLCVIRADQIVGLVPEGLASLHRTFTGKPGPLTLISGPSATSDIELERVEGVHGPRTLEVLVVE